MPSITPMMSAILREESLIEPMVCTTSDTTAPPLTATTDAADASERAASALSAFCLTAAVNSSIDDAVSSSELACCSVRDDKSMVPTAICAEAVAMVSVPPRTSPTMLTSAVFMSRRAAINCPVSSCERTTISLLRSPCATRWATATASTSGRRDIAGQQDRQHASQQRGDGAAAQQDPRRARLQRNRFLATLP